MEVARDGCRDVHLGEAAECSVDRGEVPLDHRATALAVGLLDRVLDRLDRFVLRQHSGEREEARLKDGVDAPAQSGVASDVQRVDDVEPEALLDDLALGLDRQVSPNLVGPEGAAQQERRARRSELQHVHPLQELELVARDEVRLSGAI